MKTAIITALLLIALSINTNAQIPNSGFENWTSILDYEDPTYWGSTNSYSAGPFYAITKSTDHYPTSIGQYSVRLENNTGPFIPYYAGRGFLASGPPPPNPDFPVTGHPTSLTGYYKFIPENGDTMYIFVQLYSNGSSVADGLFKSTQAATEWTSFSVPFSSYANADSASILFAAYHANGFDYVPYGNSVLYIDNINFDNLITGVAELETEPSFSLYPNPANQSVVIGRLLVNGVCELSIYNAMGQLVHSEILSNNQQQIDVSDFSSGVYTVELHTSGGVKKQKLIIQH